MTAGERRHARVDCRALGTCPASQHGESQHEEEAPRT